MTDQPGEGDLWHALETLRAHAELLGRTSHWMQNQHYADGEGWAVDWLDRQPLVQALTYLTRRRATPSLRWLVADWDRVVSLRSTYEDAVADAERIIATGQIVSTEVREID